MEHTYEKVLHIISTISGVEAEKIKEETNLYEDLDIDSVMILEFITQLEENWKFHLRDYPELLDEIEIVENLVFFLDNLER